MTLDEIAKKLRVDPARTMLNIFDEGMYSLRTKYKFVLDAE